MCRVQRPAGTGHEIQQEKKQAEVIKHGTWIRHCPGLE